MKAGEYVWDDPLTWCFLQLYRDNLDKFRNPSVRNKDLYVTICQELLKRYPNEPLTPQLLSKKFFNLKRTHEKILFKKHQIENYEVQWKYFDAMTKLLSGNTPSEVALDDKNDSFKFEYAWKDNVTYEFLELYLERINDFKNPKVRNKSIFENIAASLQISNPEIPINAHIVQKKFYNMKRTYLDIAQKKSANKNYPINWKFFNKVHAIMSLTEPIKAEYLYDFETKESEEYLESEYKEPIAKKFKKEYVPVAEMDDINFDEYVEYENVEYEIEDSSQTSIHKPMQMISKFDIEMDEEEEEGGEEGNEEELETGQIIDLQMVDEEGHFEEEEEEKLDDSGNIEEQQQQPPQTIDEIFRIAIDSEKVDVEVQTVGEANESAQLMKSKLELEGG